MITIMINPEAEIHLIEDKREVSEEIVEEDEVDMVAETTDVKEKNKPTNYIFQIHISLNLCY